MAFDRLRTKHPQILDVRQVGLHIGIEFAPVGELGTADASRIRQEALKRGLLLGLGGFDPNVIKVKPPLTITSMQVAEVVHTLTDTLEACS